MLVEHCADVTKRNLDAYGIVLLEAGGCGDMPAWRRMFGEHGFQVPLAQLIDADAVLDGALDPFINGYLKWMSVQGRKTQEQ